MNYHSIDPLFRTAHSRLQSSRRTSHSVGRKGLFLVAACVLAGLFALAAAPASTPRSIGAPTLLYDIAAVVGDVRTPLTYRENTPTAEPAPTPIFNSWPTAAPTLIYDFVSVVDRNPSPPKPGENLATPQPTPEPTPEITPEPTPEATPEPSPMPASYYKQQLLELINQARSEAGLMPVALVDRPAPQQQAESALENCLFSNWGLDGLKPYMRMSLAGGYQANGEIVAAYGSCSPSEAIRWAGGESVVLDVMARWRGSRLDWDNNILDPWSTKVSIGLAWNDYFYAVHVHFERDFIEFAVLPSINSDGILSMKGSLRNGVSTPRSDDLLIDVYYDPPPERLTPGQLNSTNCYVYGETGLLVAALRPPPPPDHNYPDDTLSIHYVVGCNDPYDVQRDAPAATEFLMTPSVSLSMNQGEAYWVTASGWNVSDDSFSVTADLGSVIDEYGDGVYTILVWAVSDSGEDVLVGTHSVFVGISVSNSI